MSDTRNEASAIYLVGHGSFQQPRLIELQYRRIMRYIEARQDNTAGSFDVFVDFNCPRDGRTRTLDQLPNLCALSERTNDYTRVFIDIEASGFDNVSVLVHEALEGRGSKLLNVFYDVEDVMDQKLKSMYGKNARADYLTDGSDFTCFFPNLVAEVLEAALRQEIIADNPSSIWKRISSLRALRPYRGGKKPFIEDRLSLEWRRRSK